MFIRQNIFPLWARVMMGKKFCCYREIVEVRMDLCRSPS